MLYVTTRNKSDVYTAQRALHESRGSDGGLFIPFRDPCFSPEELEALAQKRFSDCVAQVLNLLFQTRLTGWDVDFCVGRHPVRLDRLNQKIILGECWHNPKGVFSETVQSLTEQLSSGKDGDQAGSWATVGVRIAVLFGIYAELSRNGIASPEKPFDVSVVSGDFSAPISAWYARKWGLPIGNIICCCNENGDIWNLFCHGQLRTDSVAVSTPTPEADVVIPEHLEQLICALGAPELLESYLESVRTGTTFYLEETFLAELRRGMYVTVVGQQRMRDTIVSFFGNNRCVLSPYAALACAGLQDYRSAAGENRWGLVLSERSPACDRTVVAESLGVAPERIDKYL